jgi:hypothetical protein
MEDKKERIELKGELLPGVEPVWNSKKKVPFGSYPTFGKSIKKSVSKVENKN